MACIDLRGIYLLNFLEGDDLVDGAFRSAFSVGLQDRQKLLKPNLTRTVPVHFPHLFFCQTEKNKARNLGLGLGISTETGKFGEGGAHATDGMQEEEKQPHRSCK